MHFGFGEREVHRRIAVDVIDRPPVRGAILKPPHNVERRALDGAASYEIRFGVVDVGGRALRLAADIVSDGQPDGRKRRREPEHGEQRGTAVDPFNHRHNRSPERALH